MRPLEITVSASTAVIAAMAIQRRKLVRYFIQARALSAETAVSAESLPHDRFRLLEKFERQGIVLATREGRLYLDQAGLGIAQAVARARTRRMMANLASILALAALSIAGLGYFLAA